MKDAGGGDAVGGARGFLSYGFLSYWAPPVVIGLAVGLALVWGVRVFEIGRSEVDGIVARWEWGANDANAALADEIAALGPSARSDVVDAFRSVDNDYPDLKVWVAQRLTEEPFFDTESLVDAARGDDVWQRRTAAVAIALRRREEADPDVVMPGILDWLKDLTIDDHELAVAAAVAVGPLPLEWESRIRAALVDLAHRRPPVSGDPADDWSPEDREVVIREGLVHMLGSPGDETAPNGVLDVLHEVMTDEDDDYAPRVAAVRVLSENGRFERFDAWKAAGASANDVVRQAVADNLFRAKDRAFGEILKPMHTDAHALVRGGSLDTQVVRRQPTMLDVVDQLLEDSDVWVRFAATQAVAVFRDAPGGPQRAAMLIRMLEESDEPVDAEGAVLALSTMTGEIYGFRDIDVHPQMEEVEEAALDAFMKDPEGRAEAADKYRAKFGGVAYTTADRIAVLEKLLKHADPDNRARAAKLLTGLR